MDSPNAATSTQQQPQAPASAQVAYESSSDDDDLKLQRAASDRPAVCGDAPGGRGRALEPLQRSFTHASGQRAHPPPDAEAPRQLLKPPSLASLPRIPPAKGALPRDFSTTSLSDQEVITRGQPLLTPGHPRSDEAPERSAPPTLQNPLTHAAHSLVRVASTSTSRVQRSFLRKLSVLVILIGNLIQYCIIDPINAFFDRHPGAWEVVVRILACFDRGLFLADMIMDIAICFNFWKEEQHKWLAVWSGLVAFPYLFLLFFLSRAFRRECERRGWETRRWMLGYWVLSPVWCLMYDVWISVRYLFSEPVDSSGLGRIARYYLRLRLFTETSLETLPQNIFQVYVTVEERHQKTGISLYLVITSLCVSTIVFIKCFVLAILESKQRGISLFEYMGGLLKGGGFLPYQDILLKEEVYKLQMKRLQELDDDDLERLFDMAGTNKFLRVLNLASNGLGRRGVERVVNRCLLQPSHLTVLVLDRNHIDSRGATMIAEALSTRIAGLRELGLAHNRIDDAGAVELGEALAAHNLLEKVDLSYNDIADAGASRMAQAVEASECLRSVRLKGNAIGSRGAAELAAALRRNAVLRLLDLSENQIGPDGPPRPCCLPYLPSAPPPPRPPPPPFFSFLLLPLPSPALFSRAIAVAEALHTNTGLQRLGLSVNAVEDAGAEALALALRRNAVLEDVRLAKCGLGDGGVRALVEALLENATLRILDLRDNDVTFEVREGEALHRAETAVRGRHILVELGAS
eukprot:tig00020553_g10534.t1